MMGSEGRSTRVRRGDLSEAALHTGQSLGKPVVRQAAPAVATRGYIPALDGLRAVAIILVLLGHFGLGRVVPGGFGVTVFFLISGFLITRLLLVEYVESGKIDYLRFYARRFARLAPALVVVIASVTAAYAALHTIVPWSEVVAAFLYVINYYRIFHAVDIIPLGILWSLAVEEHFYLVFPLAFAGLLRSQRVVPALITAIAVALVWRVVLVLVLHASEDYTYMATDARFDSILYGALLAILAHRWAGALPLRRLMAPALSLLAILVLLSTFVIRNPVLRETVRYSVQGLALMPLVAAIVFSDRPLASGLRAMFAAPPLVFVGKLSYSLYLWHYSGLVVADYLLPTASPVAKLPVSLGFAVVTSLLSYFVVERSFLTLRKRLGSHAR